MKIGDLVKLVHHIEQRRSHTCSLGIIVSVDGFWWQVYWITEEVTCGYTADSLEVL